MSHRILLSLFVLLFASTYVRAGDAVTPTSDPSTAGDARPIQSDRFAINTHLRWPGEGTKWLPTIAAGGFSMFRDGEEWRGIEKTPGVYGVSPVTDQMIEQGNRAGVEPLLVLAYGNSIYPNNLDPEKFAEHALWLMDRYKGKVKYWELWNEPENFFFRKQYGGAWNGVEKDGSESPWVGKFADFVTIVAAKLKAAHPEIKLMTGTSAVVDARFLHAHPRMWDNIDILSIHPYTYKLPPEIQPYGGPKIRDRDGLDFAGADHSFASQIQVYRDLLAKIGKPNMPIWITEFGYSTFWPHKPSNLWAGFTESAQAIYLARFGVLAASLGIDRTFFYCFMDSGNDDSEVEQRFGLVRRDGSPKPSYVALQRLAGIMPGDTRPVELSVKVKRLAPTTRTDATAWDSQTVEYLDKPQICSFKRPDGKMVIFLWRPGRIYADVQDEQCELQIDVTARPLRVIEVGSVGSGERINTKPLSVDGALTVPRLRYSSDPIYLILQ